MLQPMALNSVAPALGVGGCGEHRVARRRLGRSHEARERLDVLVRVFAANASEPSAHSVASDTVSNAATELPIDVFSVSSSRLVIPISFRYASAANDSRLACWFFQPKRPPRTLPGASSTGTWMNWPRIWPLLCPGCALAIAIRVFELIASTKPSPSTLVDIREACGCSRRRARAPGLTRRWRDR